MPSTVLVPGMVSLPVLGELIGGQGMWAITKCVCYSGDQVPWEQR